MEKKTVCIDSNVGQRLDKFDWTNSTHLVFMGKGIPLAEKITLGRDERNSIVLDGNLISRFHAEIQRIGKDFYVRDMNSVNGTFVNGYPVPKGKYRKLNENDVIRLGRHEISLVKTKGSA